MPLARKSSLLYSTVVLICVCVECGQFQSQPTKSNLSEVSRISGIPDTNLETTLNTINPIKTNIYLEENLKNFSASNNSSTNPLNRPNAQEVRKTTAVNKEFTEFALEGGGVGFPSQNSSVKSQHQGVFNEEFHNKGSKGRKGVKYPGSSVVPRKGVSVAVDQLGEFSSTNTKNIDTFTNKSLANKNMNIVMDSNASLLIHYELNTTEVLPLEETPIGVGLFNITHSKKPEYVSDEKDIDDFDKYSIIKTSTTGEDYVIIGIVIVIGIWLSVFGALIFYRRAGEYWDRRHYRRMDFLVEGMYND